MGRMPRVTGTQLVRALNRAGWEQARRQRGSHVQLEHPDRVGIVTVPMHAGETITPWLLGRILKQAGMTVEELREFL